MHKIHLDLANVANQYARPVKKNSSNKNKRMYNLSPMTTKRSSNDKFNQFRGAA